MNRYRPVAFLALLLTVVSSHAATRTGRAVRVIDGDTIVVLDAEKVQHQIRLQGIDAPEHGQAFGTKSKKHLSGLVAGKTVAVDYIKYDRHQRILGKVLVNGEEVNLEQVEDGIAWHYQKYQGELSASDRIKYSDAELEARRHKVGLWRDPDAVPPWDYRKAKRDRRTGMEPFVGQSRVW